MPVSPVEGTAVAPGSTLTDAGSADTQTTRWSVTKDGAADILPEGTVTDAASFAFTPSDNGGYVVSLLVTDDDGGMDVATLTVTVDNVCRPR